MKTLLIILIFLEVIFALVAFTPIFIDKKSAAQALVEWKNNPTPENEAVWSREATALRRERNIIDISIFTLLAVNTVGLVVLIQKIKKSSIS
jgi:hypothetical protein